MLVPLVNQFGLMQQQMFDQFQQAMAMMVQMFGKMHRDQMEVIRAELDRLHDLTEEFHALKTELAQRTQVQPSATAPFEPAIGRAEMGRLTATDPIASSQSPAFEKSCEKKPFQARESSGVQPASATRRVPEQSYSESPFSGRRRRPSRLPRNPRLPNKSRPTISGCRPRRTTLPRRLISSETLSPGSINGS